MNKTALVTGAGRRVGRAVSLELARNGFDVALHFRNSRSEVESLAAECKTLGSDAWCVAGDLADEHDVGMLGQQVGERWSSLDILVNNASTYSPEPFGEITNEAWNRMMMVNLTAPFILARDLLSPLRSGDGGLVVNMCDIGGDRPFPGYAHYSVSKAGLIMLVKAMAVELGPLIRAVGISPGHVIWPEAWDESSCETMAEQIPLSRVGTPQDVADLVRFLALEGHYINGTVVNVDGGLSARY